MEEKKIEVEDLHYWYELKTCDILTPYGISKNKIYLEPNCDFSEYVERWLTERLGFVYNPINKSYVNNEDVIFWEETMNEEKILEHIRNLKLSKLTTK